MKGNADSFVQNINMIGCVHGVRTNLNLETGAAIFYFNETQKLENKEFFCHYEVETKPGYGFHVYIDEMYLNDQGRSEPCVDYIQFARSVQIVYVT